MSRSLRLPLALAEAALAGPHVARQDRSARPRQRQTFRLTPGFEAKLVAAAPTIDKPMNLAFDAKGRLWVACSREYPRPAKPGAAAQQSGLRPPWPELAGAASSPVDSRPRTAILLQTHFAPPPSNSRRPAT